MDQNLINKIDSKTNRKSYLKPQLSRISLVAREAVLGVGCKTEAGGISGGFNDTASCTLPMPCTNASS